LIKDLKVYVDEIAITSHTYTKIEQYLQNLSRDRTNINKEWFDISVGLGIKAEHIVPHKILSQALQAKSLVIIPHNIFHVIPWAGLYFNEKRLFEYCPIGILPNLSCIPILNTNFSSISHISLIGAPEYQQPKLNVLEYAADEIKNIEEKYRNHRCIVQDSLTGKEATEENFWKIANFQNREKGIFHIVCHGYFDSYEPMNSGLLFAKSAKVSAEEISNSLIKYNEIILSACSTGRRSTKFQNIKLIADDIVGLPGSFLESGAKSILVSIPPAGDNTAYTFMSLYHKNRLEGTSPLFALQKTQLLMINDSYRSRFSIYDWIGFTLYGCQ
jgi:CHAT domain-containing protein